MYGGGGGVTNMVTWVFEDKIYKCMGGVVTNMVTWVFEDKIYKCMGGVPVWSPGCLRTKCMGGGTSMDHISMTKSRQV